MLQYIGITGKKEGKIISVGKEGKEESVKSKFNTILGILAKLCGVTY